MNTFSSYPHASRTILLIDEDIELAQTLSHYLGPDNYRIISAHSGLHAKPLLAQQNFDIVLLDLLLPDTNGLNLLRYYRSWSQQPVIMFTQDSTETDRVLGLEFGADDFLTKPFSPRELKARIQAVLRRFNLSPADAQRRSSCLQLGELSLNPSAGQATLRDQALHLTGAQQRVLEVLMRAAGQIVPRPQIAHYALGREPGPYDRSVDTHVSALRKKLQTDTAGASLTIRNVRNQGYALCLTSVTE